MPTPTTRHRTNAALLDLAVGAAMLLAVGAWLTSMIDAVR